MQQTMPNIQSIILGGGCFWCIEAAFQEVPGVIKVTSGYAGGVSPDPTYEQVSAGKTGHAEVVLVEFDADKTSLDQVLFLFWKLHDPTSLNKQGHDVGAQYRSCIFYTTNAQLQTIEEHIKTLEDEHIYENPIVTQVEKLTQFYRAENYHQNYYKQHPEQGYCQLVITPKLNKLKEILGN
jgi:methionine-S-sulfoxide reductase